MLFWSSTWNGSNIPDLNGRVAIVTGANTGLGFETVKELARHGAKVYLLCRTESRARKAIEAIEKTLPDAKLEYIEFDLLSMNSAKRAAEEFLQRETRLDMLINNAGIMATPYELGPDGIEEQACNGTGHFALTIPLLPILKETASKPDSHVRIVNVSSQGYEKAQNPDFTSLDGLNQHCESTWNRYGNSKLSNMLFTNELQKRLEGTGIYCLTANPGAALTGLQRGIMKSWPITRVLTIFNPVMTLILPTPAQAASVQLYAATSLEIEEKDLKAAYIVPGPKSEEKKPLAQDEQLAADFWALCETLFAQKTWIVI